MANGADALGGDGCTGFQWAEALWDIRQCCFTHDDGGSDGTLLDCLHNAGVPIELAAGAILIMVLARPTYRKLKPHIERIRQWLHDRR